MMCAVMTICNPGDKAIIICNSLSKTYSVTGWRLGCSGFKLLP